MSGTRRKAGRVFVGARLTGSGMRAPCSTRYLEASIMKRSLSRSLLTLLLCLFCASLFAQGAGRQPTGAEYWMKLEKELGLQTRYEVEMEIQAMGMNMASKTYRLDGKTRTETRMPIFNTPMIALETEEDGKPASFMLFPDKKQYVRNETPTEDKAPAYTLTEAGFEVHNGENCRKRLLTVTAPEGHKQEMTILFSPSQKNMPVKIAATVQTEATPEQAPMTIESVVLFKNYVFRPPAAALFTLPSDYTRASSMQEVMMGGGLFGGGGLAGGEKLS